MTTDIDISGSNFSENTAAIDGGAASSDSGRITVSQSTIRENSSGNRGGGIYSSSGITINNGTIIDANVASGSGGGLYTDSLLLRDSSITNNQAVENGGGIRATQSTIIVNSNISNNESDTSGGGISLANFFGRNQALIANTTISRNQAKENGGGITVGGGEIEQNSITDENGEPLPIDPTRGELTLFPEDLFLVNVTIAGNLADSDNNGEGYGGGIYNVPLSRISLSDSRDLVTIPADITIENSILAGNFDTPDNNGNGFIAPDIGGAARGNANNLLGSTQGLTIEPTFVAPDSESLGAGSDIISANPGLGNLQDNGGSTATIQLLSGSPAINGGDNNRILQETFTDVNGDGNLSTIDFNGDGDTEDAIPYDQRGGEFSRIFGETVDIGAFEVQEVLPEDNPPTVVTPIEDITISDNSNNQTIDVSNLFQDEDGDEISITVQGNTNRQLVTTSIANNTLTLNFAEERSGTADITLRGTANGETVEDIFTVTVESEDTETPTIDLFRFRNTTFDTGTYVFVGEQEKDDILEDENLSNTFSLDGEQDDGTVNPAFTASATPGEGLISFYRLKSLDVLGTFLFVAQQEYDDIFAEDSNQRNKWEKEGLDADGEDIPEFYLYDGSSDIGTEFNRFQNTQNGTFLYAGEDETAAIERDPNLSNLFTNQGVAFKSL